MIFCGSVSLRTSQCYGVFAACMYVVRTTAGAGIVNKKVLENCGIDSEEYSGLAFGIGIERLAMLKYGINNIKLLYQSDMRVLDQINDD